MTSGPEYGAEVNGNAWDMSDTNDLNDDVPPPLQTCVTNQQYSNGIYAAGVTLPVCPAGQPYADPILYLGHMNRNAPGALDPVVDTNKYRYLTYRFTKSGTRWSMMRFGWWQISATDNGVNEAPVMSRDILIIDGWHTYQIDLWADDVVDESYPAGTPGWRQSHPNRLRLDPNEQAAEDLPVTVQVDWIKLTAMDSVAKGTPFPIQFEVAAGQPQTVSLYYNTDKNPANSGISIGTMTVKNQPEEPTAAGARQLAGLGSKVATSYSELNHHIYLASLQNGHLTCSGNCFIWDTSNVPVGTYYVCIRAEDGYNVRQQCSEAPVAVTQ